MLDGKLGDFVAKGGGKIHTGPFGSQLHASDYVRHGIPCIMPANMKNNRIDLSDVVFIAEADAQRLSKYLVKENDILYSRRGDVTQKALIRKKEVGYFCGTGCLLLRPGENFDARFLTHYLSIPTIKGWIISQAVGARMPNLNTGILSDIPFHGPEKAEQEKIANVLSTLEDAMEINDKIGQTLEVITKTLYDYWFVQFDFPDENGKPYKSSGGRMVWSEALKTEIPNGWKVQKISEIIRDEKNGDWGKEEETQKYTNKVFCIRGADINGLNGKEFCNPPQRFISTNSTDKILLAHDLIIEISGGSPRQSTGRIAHISQTTKNRFTSPLVCSNFCKAITLTDFKFAYNFLFFWERLYDNNIFFGYEGKTSGIKNLLFDAFVKTNYILIPDENTITNFFELMERIQEKKEKLLEENQRLAELRDWLLPILMNGQVVIK